MKNKAELFALLLFLVLVTVAAISFSGFGFSPRQFLASVFFIDSVTVDGLQHNFKAAKEGKGKVGVLIVPGHDDASPGAVFKGVREADLTREVGLKLADYFNDDDEFEVILLRNENGYNQDFLNYFNQNRSSLERFVTSKKQTMISLIDKGLVQPFAGVDHNAVSYDKALRLYAINQWVNERGIDVVVHIHFNDYGGRRAGKAGKYSGLAVYIPESQYSNAKASLALGKSVFEKLREYGAVSNLPKESKGLVEDQELIALGSYNTADAASVLIEYGYVYEPQFQDKEIRAHMIQELAYKTYLGFSSFFGHRSGAAFSTLFLPYEWNDTLTKNATNREAVLALQSALVFSKLYPPAGLTKNDCPVNGYFGPCTEVSLKKFQEKEGISERGTVGPETRKKLNELFGY